MSKQIIIDWQANDLLVATCKGRGSSTTLDKLSQQSVSEEADIGSATAAQALAKAVSELGLGKSDVTVVASREMVEVRTISVPHIDADELPDVIRFQAQRQLANMSDNWTLDYVMLPDEPGQEMRTALVAAISPSHMSQIESACSAANLQLSHIGLRPIEIARFALASGKLSGNSANMVVCISEQHADLIILKSDNVVLIRGTKLPSEREQWATVLQGETRRSLMSASSQLGSASIERVILIANPELAAVAEGPIADATSSSISVVDPSTLLPAKLDGRDQLVSTATNRLVGIAGATLHASVEKKNNLDFKNPKRRPPKKKNTTLYILAAAASIVLVLAGVSWWFKTNNDLDAELALLESEIEGKKELVAASREKVSELREIESFLDASPNFLDELAYISERIPPSDQVRIESPTFSTLADGKGQIAFSLQASSNKALSDFGSKLRDENHVVSGKGPSELSQPTEHYKWQDRQTITVADRGWKLLDQLQLVSEDPMNEGEAVGAETVENKGIQPEPVAELAESFGKQ